MRVAIIGASGYTGLELVRIVLRHPELELAVVTSEQRAGKPAADCFPALRGLTDLCFEANDPQSLTGRVDVAFCCLPHAASATTVAAIRKAGIVTLDISADFRLRSAAVYAQWYGEHKAPELFGQAVYGMPEIYRDLLPGAALIAAPGCYPTGALLPMLPFLRAGVVETNGIFVDAKSGVSGAGRSLQDGFLFAELDGNSHAYKVGSHRHGPEMEQEASLAANQDVSLTFIPYLTHIGSWRCLIEGVRIHKHFRNQGLGTRFFEWAIERAKGRGCSMVQLTSDKQRPEALRFYQQLGFKASHEGFKLTL